MTELHKSIIKRHKRINQELLLIELIETIQRSDDIRYSMSYASFSVDNIVCSIHKIGNRVFYNINTQLEQTIEERLCFALLLSIYLEYQDFLTQDPIFINDDWQIFSKIRIARSRLFQDIVWDTAQFILINDRLFEKEYRNLRREWRTSNSSMLGERRENYIIRELSERFRVPDILIRHKLAIHFSST